MLKPHCCQYSISLKATESRTRHMPRSRQSTQHSDRSFYCLFILTVPFLLVDFTCLFFFPPSRAMCPYPPPPFHTRPAKEENMGKEGAILVLTVFDHDLIRENTFVGICVVPCKDIPQLLDEAPSVLDRTAPQRKNLTLPLFQLADSRCFRELNLRNQVDYDHESTDFVKLLNKKYQTPTGPGVLSRLYTATKDAMYI